MRDTRRGTWILVTFVIGVLAAGGSFAGEEATVAEQIGGLQEMCADSESARAQRHAAKPLYFRLGEYEKIHLFVREVVRLHFENEALEQIMVGIDGERLAKNVADFVSTGTGGPKVYTGRDMTTAHARFNMTDAHFLAAGHDIVTAMQATGYGQEEIDEFLCILVSMKDLVVLEQAP